MLALGCKPDEDPRTPNRAMLIRFAAFSIQVFAPPITKPKRNARNRGEVKRMDHRDGGAYRSGKHDDGAF